MVWYGVWVGHEARVMDKWRFSKNWRETGTEDNNTRGSVWIPYSLGVQSGRAHAFEFDLDHQSCLHEGMNLDFKHINTLQV